MSDTALDSAHIERNITKLLFSWNFHHSRSEDTNNKQYIGILYNVS